MFNVSYVPGNVSSLMGREDSAEIEKTGKERYILSSTAILLLSISVPLKRRLFTISFRATSDYASLVRVAI